MSDNAVLDDLIQEIRDGLTTIAVLNEKVNNVELLVDAVPSLLTQTAVIEQTVQRIEASVDTLTTKQEIVARTQQHHTIYWRITAWILSGGSVLAAGVLSVVKFLKGS